MTAGIGDEITPPEKKDGKSKLDKLQEKLYSPTAFVGGKPRKKLENNQFSKQTDTQSNWDEGNLNSILSEDKPSKKRINVFAIVAVLSFLFFVGAATYGFLKFWSGGQFTSGNNIDLVVTGPVSVGGGEELALDILVQNNNSSPIETVDLVIEYPDGTKQATDLRTDLPRIREGLGIIEPDSIIRRTHAAALFGEEGSSKQIEVRVEYRLSGSNAIFEESKTFDVILKSSPVRLVVDSVKEITANQELSFDISLTSNSNQQIDNVLLKAQYPFGFSFESATINPTFGSNTWFFENLKPNETKKITLKGKMVGQDGEDRVFKFSSGIADENNAEELGVTFTTLPKSIAISQAFLGLDLVIDGDSNPVISKEANRAVGVNVIVRNNTDSNLEDVDLNFTLTGDVLNESSVTVTDGFYRSSDNTVIWDSSDNAALANLLPGRSVSLAFEFISLPLVSQSALYKNPEITISGKVFGKRVSESSVPETLESDSIKKIRFISELNLARDIEHVSGPIPPKSEQQTRYKAKIDLYNSSNKINNGIITADIPVYVDWVGNYSGSENVNYDPVSRKLKWDLGDVSAGAGYDSSLRSISFDVVLNPSVSQLGSAPILVRNILFSGFDSFTARNIEFRSEDINTVLGTLDNRSGVVVE